MEFIKKNPIKLLIITFFLLNSFGFCYKRMWFLSDQERIEIALKREGALSDSGRFRQVSLSESSGEPPGTTKYIIPYKSAEAFFSANPDCCMVSRSMELSEGIIRISFVDCITGTAPYFVSGKYRQHYKINEVVNTEEHFFTYRISSCGHLISGLW